jgi:hypothetical protein
MKEVSRWSYHINCFAAKAGVFKLFQNVQNGQKIKISICSLTLMMDQTLVTKLN